MNDWIKIILPALITVGLNVLFYLIIKKGVDKSIEQYKISYSGIFKERINIYRELLKKTYSAKLAISSYQYGDRDGGVKVMRNLNEFNDFFRINEPFLSKKMIENFRQIYKDLQEVFEPMYLLNIATASEERMQYFFKEMSKLQENESFLRLENLIIQEMREYLQTI